MAAPARLSPQKGPDNRYNLRPQQAVVVIFFHFRASSLRMIDARWVDLVQQAFRKPISNAIPSIGGGTLKTSGERLNTSATELYKPTW